MLKPLEPQLDMFSDLWWLFAVAIFAVLVGTASKTLVPRQSRRRRRSRREIRREPERRPPAVRAIDLNCGASHLGDPLARVEFNSRVDSEPRRLLDVTLAGKAYVTDGDGLPLSGREVRFAGLDTPEWNQVAKHRDGYWFGHGRRVKSALIPKIGGKPILVTVEDYDKFGRAVGIVTCNGQDVGEWLVREGHAIAAHGDRYKHIEQEARTAGRGMWSHAVNIDPRRWRHRSRSPK